MFQLSAGLFYYFLCGINFDIFCLAQSRDFTANLLFFIGISSAFLNAVFGVKMYYQHRVISAIIIQLGIFFSASMMTIQLFDTAYHFFEKRELAEKLEEAKGFNQTKDFERKEKKGFQGKDSIRNQ
jgi:hypothetical protein